EAKRHYPCKSCEGIPLWVVIAPPRQGHTQEPEQGQMVGVHPAGHPASQRDKRLLLEWRQQSLLLPRGRFECAPESVNKFGHISSFAERAHKDAAGRI